MKWLVGSLVVGGAAVAAYLLLRRPAFPVVQAQPVPKQNGAVRSDGGILSTAGDVLKDAGAIVNGISSIGGWFGIGGGSNTPARGGGDFNVDSADFGHLSLTSNILDG